MHRVPPDARYCVYSHAIDGEVFYIGKGRPIRPFEKQCRNYLWHAKTKGRGYEIEILGWYDNEQQALDAEADLILMFRPSCNILMPNRAITNEPPLSCSALREKTFQGKQFLRKFFDGPADLIRVVTGHELGEPNYEMVNKWFQRGKISADWFPLLLCTLEIEHGEPVKLWEFYA